MLALAAAGLAIASYLAAYQLGAVAHVWDPLFDGGSADVLHSALSRLLPVPDALLGALGYVAELVLTSVGGEDRYRTRPTVVILLGGVVTAMAVVSSVLVFLQLVVIGHLCTLCLASAGLSFVILPLAWEEVAGTIDALLSAS